MRKNLSGASAREDIAMHIRVVAWGADPAGYVSLFRNDFFPAANKKERLELQTVNQKSDDHKFTSSEQGHLPGQ